MSFNITASPFSNTTCPACPNESQGVNSATAIASIVLSVLLVISEGLALTKKPSAVGILQGILSLVSGKKTQTLSPDIEATQTSMGLPLNRSNTV